MLEGYYNQFNPILRDERILIRSGRGLQGRELNEMQDLAAESLRSVGDAIFRDGDVVAGCALVIDAETGVSTVEAGRVYLRGRVRDVPAGDMIVPVDQPVAVGLRWLTSVVTELEDPTLREPDIGANYNEPGAGRLRWSLAWGWQGAGGASDGGTGDFYPVYTVVNGILENVTAPPVMDATRTEIARYDRQSSGGHYVVSGLALRFLNRAAGDQVFTLSEGAARVYGYEINRETAQRLRLPETPDLREVAAEAHLFADSGDGTCRIDLANGPLATVASVTVTRQRTVTVSHGAYSGAADPLPDTGVVALVTVSQAGTPFTEGVDYRRSGDMVDWSLSGAEPAPGSTYEVVYQHLASITPDSTDDDGLVVSGAVDGTQVLIAYAWKLPRLDALVMDQDGAVSWIHGLPSALSPSPPAVPAGRLRLATVAQNWHVDRPPDVMVDAIRAVPFDEIEGLRRDVADLQVLMATERLTRDVTSREPTAARGSFADPFFDDDLRDGGLEQSAAVVDGRLMLPITEDVQAAPSHQADRLTLPYVLEPVIDQPLRTGSMAINPYQVFEPVPARVVLEVNPDRWTVQREVVGPATRRFTGARDLGWTRTTTVSRVVATAAIEELRPVTVTLTADGFGPGEEISRVRFDGITVDVEAG